MKSRRRRSSARACTPRGYSQRNDGLLEGALALVGLVTVGVIGYAWYKNSQAQQQATSTTTTPALAPVATTVPVTS